MDKWLSIIVPIYNAEKYLAECVDSLLDQDFDKELYEIFLYDDGSKDGSLRIAEDYARRYPNIRVFTHLNAGVSATRNAGLDEAVGEYVWYVDSDDMIAKDILTVLHDCTEQTKVDILFFDHVRFNADSQWKVKDFTVKETDIISGRKAFLDFYYDPAPWNKLLRRDFMKEHNLYFAQKLSEDSEWGSRCFYHAIRFKAIAVDVVYYRVTPTSLSHDEKNRKRLLEEGLLPCMERHYEYMLTHPDNRFWMRALVLDIRRIHNVGLDRLHKSAYTKEEYDGYLRTEAEICRRIVSHLPFSIRLDYWILLGCAYCPSLIVRTQRLLRRTKKLLKR